MNDQELKQLEELIQKYIEDYSFSPLLWRVSDAILASAEKGSPPSNATLAYSRYMQASIFFKNRASFLRGGIVTRENDVQLDDHRFNFEL